MTGEVILPPAFKLHPKFAKWRKNIGCLARFTHLMGIMQDGGNPRAICLQLHEWEENVIGTVQAFLKFLREGVTRGFWHWNEQTGALHLSALLCEENVDAPPSVSVQPALPLYEETRPPSKQPDATAAYMRERRAKKRDGGVPATPQDIAARRQSATPPEQTAAASVSSAAHVAENVGANVRSEHSNNASNSPSNISNTASNSPATKVEMLESVRNDVGNVRSDVRKENTAYSLASLAELAVCKHTKALARALSLAAQITKNAQYPHNQMAPSEKEIHRLLQIGHAAHDIETAIAKCQDSPAVQKGGGLGEKGWRTWLERKLDTPDAARTQRLDMLVPSEVKSSDNAPRPSQQADAPPATSLPAPLQNIAYDSQGKAVTMSPEAVRALERSRREREEAQGGARSEGMGRLKNILRGSSADDTQNARVNEARKAG